MRVTISVPQTKNDKWAISFGGGARKRNTAATVYNALRRKVQVRGFKEKTTIVVKMGTTTINESIASSDPRYLLYTTGCFLEDFLKENTYAQYL